MDRMDDDGPAGAAERKRSGKIKETKLKAGKQTRVRFRPEQRREALVQAAIRCLGEGGMSAFRLERICIEANVSLGLINHYFASKTELLIAVYRAALYDDVNKIINRARDDQAWDGPGSRSSSVAEARLCELVEAMVNPEYLKPSVLTVWLALWGEIVSNTQLRHEHKNLYRDFLKATAERIQSVAKERKRKMDATAVARNLIALIDGLCLKRAHDSRAFSHGDLRRAAYEWLEFHLGPLAGRGR